MLWAVHIADGVLDWPWLVVGWIAAIIILAWSMRSIQDDEIPKIGFLSATVFIGSQIHIPLGVTTVHLLLNGVAAAAIGRRAPLAIAVGLVLQSIIFGHGGKLTWGVNVCVLTLPAIIMVFLLNLRERISASPPSVIMKIAIGLMFSVSVSLLITSIQILIWKITGDSPRVWIDHPSLMWITKPFGIAFIVIISMIAAWKLPPAYALGLWMGGVCAMLTVVLNAIAIHFGGMDDIRSTAVVGFLAHVPVIAIEAMAVSSLLAYLSESTKP